MVLRLEVCCMVEPESPPGFAPPTEDSPGGAVRAVAAAPRQQLGSIGS